MSISYISIEYGDQTRWVVRYVGGFTQIGSINTSGFISSKYPISNTLKASILSLYREVVDTETNKRQYLI